MSMQQIKVNRVQLLEKVRANRETHRETFLKAQIGFREQVIEYLDKMLKDAKKGIQYRLHVGLPEPQDMTKEYDCVVAMLEMSVDDTIEISQQEFSQYALDQWNWKASWATTTANYTKGA